MIFIWDGNTGQGKTYMSSLDTMRLLQRNKYWFEKKKTKVKRTLATNIALSEKVLEEYDGYIKYWTDLEQLVNMRESDVIFDDMASYLDSQRWADTPMSVKRWLRLHEHFGCDIYGNAQDFKTIDPSVRRLTTELYRVQKIFGSRRPSATKPVVKRIWGIILIKQVRLEDYAKENSERNFVGWPKFQSIKRKICNVFDTTQELQQSEWPPLHHIERSCLETGCEKVVVKHI